MLFKNLFKIGAITIVMASSLFSQTSYDKDILEKKIYPMGEKIYKKMCKEIDTSRYDSMESLKDGVVSEKLCKPLKDKHLEALGYYLWDKNGKDAKDDAVIHVHEKEKCPVCGMFVYKYPRWAAQIDGFYFDGVKDMMKFYFSPKEWGDYPSKESFEKLLVTDYYSQKAIDAKKAFYVIGSDVYGPMGNELIPFIDEDEAKIFSIDHFGKKIIKFDDITEDEVYKLDE